MVRIEEDMRLYLCIKKCLVKLLQKGGKMNILKVQACLLQNSQRKIKSYHWSIRESTN